MLWEFFSCRGVILNEQSQDIVNGHCAQHYLTTSLDTGLSASIAPHKSGVPSAMHEVEHCHSLDECRPLLYVTAAPNTSSYVAIVAPVFVISINTMPHSDDPLWIYNCTSVNKLPATLDWHCVRPPINEAVNFRFEYGSILLRKTHLGPRATGES